MRYVDINEGFDPLFNNITTTSPQIIGVYAPESTVYIRINNKKPYAARTEDTGLFQLNLVSVSVGDLISFQSLENGEIADFWKETIRE